MPPLFISPIWAPAARAPNRVLSATRSPSAEAPLPLVLRPTSGTAIFATGRDSSAELRCLTAAR